MRFGLIGYGKVANLHAMAINEASGCELAAVTGHNAERGNLFASKHGIPFYSDVHTMVKEGRIDAVIISTPHPQHCIYALQAIAEGCDVLVEKPMALTTEECVMMIDAADKAHVKLSVMSQRRWYPSCQRMRKAIDDGKIGTPVLGQVTMLGWRDEAYYRSDPWRGKWDTEGGGVLVNQAPHQLDLLHWFMGPVERISSEWGNLNHPYIEVEDTAVASIRFKNGGLASILVSNSEKPGIYAKVHIHGSNGNSVGVQTDGGAMFVAGMSSVLEAPYNDIWTIPDEKNLVDRWKADDEAFFSTIDATWYFFKLQIEDFVHSKTPCVTGEDGLETVKLIEGIYSAGREGKYYC
jgi:UDP-N-acetyl-2-amino-2-deoxyglucuronate dehydrogenase